MNHEVLSPPNGVWQHLLERRKEYYDALSAFNADDVPRVKLMRSAFKSRGADLHLALSLVPSLSLAERQELFPDLLFLARGAHGPIGAVRAVIQDLPRDWVVRNIKPLVEAALVAEEYDDYWMFLELYHMLDADLTRHLAVRASSHSDPDIRELGEDYIAKVDPMIRNPLPLLNGGQQKR